MSRVRTGKVARLPAEMREKINRDIYNGRPGVEIVEYLKKHDISESNLSQWRQGGYLDWEKDQRRMEDIQVRSEIAMRMAKAAGGSLGDSITRRLAGQIEETLDGISGENYKEIKPMLDAILMAEKLQIERQKVSQKDEEISLNRQKFQRDSIALFLKWHDDKKASEIADQPESNADTKIEKHGKHLFGDDWN